MKQEELKRLVEQVKQGDEDAFTALYQESVGNVYATAMKVLRDAQLAEDVTQEVFLLVYTGRLAGLKEPLAYFGWVQTVARFKSYRLRDKRREVLYNSAGETVEGMPDIQDPTPGPQQLAETGERARLVAAAVEKLPQSQRQAVELLYYRQLKVQEIAGITGDCENTIKSRLSYARRQIKRQAVAGRWAMEGA